MPQKIVREAADGLGRGRLGGVGAWRLGGDDGLQPGEDGVAAGGGYAGCSFRFGRCGCVRRGAFLLRTGHRAAGGDRREEQHGDEHGHGGLRMSRDGADALFQLASAAGHRRRGGERVDARAAGHADERPAIVGTLGFAKEADRVLVTAELRVGAHEVRAPPYKRVEPVQRETNPAQQRPEMVAVAVVRLFVCDAVPPEGVIRRAVRRQIDGRAEKAKQARRGHRRRDVDGGAARRGRDEQLRIAPQRAAKGKVAAEEPDEHARRADGPNDGQNCFQIQNAAATDGFLRFDSFACGKYLNGWLRSLLLRYCGRFGGRIRARRGVEDVMLRFGDEVFDARGALPYGEGQQQADKRQRPEGVLQLRADPAAQQVVQRDQDGEQNRRGNKPLKHRLVSPPFRLRSRAIRRFRLLKGPLCGSWR